MKKFLTVLLVIAVMFTFSFGSAFAATGVPGASMTHAEAMAQAQQDVISAFNAKITAAKGLLSSEYTEDGIHAKCKISGATYAATLDEIAKDFASIASIAAQKVDAANPTVTSASTLAGLITAETGIDINLAYAGLRVITVDVNDLYGLDAAGLVSYVTLNATTPTSTDLQAYYMVFTWTNALESMKSYLNGEIAKIDMSLYTDDVMPAPNPYKTTYAQAAAKAKQDLLDAVNAVTISVNMGQTAAATALTNMYTNVFSKIAPYKTVSTISGTVTISYKLADAAIKTAEDLENAKVLDAAQKAALKAEVQKQSAEYLTYYIGVYNASGKTDADKAALETHREEAAAFEKLNALLIDADEITSASELVGAVAANTIVKDFEKVEKLAATLKLQVEKDGSLKYDAAEIDDILETLQVKVYNSEKTSANITAADFAGALNVASDLEWKKAVEVEKVKDALDDALYGTPGVRYYDPEKAKIEAKYQAKIDKINAAATTDQLNAAVATAVTYTVDSKTVVQGKVDSFVNTGKFVTAIDNYVKYLNIGIASYADGYRAFNPVADRADVVAYLAKNGARSNTDVAEFLAQAEAYAKDIPTVGELKAEKVAVDELVKAIPNQVTLADKAAVLAAWEAADAADYTPAKLTTAIALVEDAEAKAIDAMLKALPKTLTAADKAAVDAILDAIDVYEGEEMYDYPDYAKAADARAAFEAVRAAELADVTKAIASISAVPTKAEVEAARAAVDAFVEEYTDPAYVVGGDIVGYHAIAEIVNLDKLTYAEAAIKAQEIEDVKALKLTASSTAAKGSITVKWTAEGNVAAADGYQVWKSTKHSSGYKKAFTTTKTSYKNTKGLKKGTRYYYKVRAYKVVDGKNVYSDWSNKARRIAK